MRIWSKKTWMFSLAALMLVAVFVIHDGSALSGSGVARRTEDEERAIQVYKVANEAVVFISTITLTVDPFDVFLEAQPKEGSGSGIIVDGKRGIIITNLHVIQDAHQIEIMLANGKNYSARLMGYDREYDIAVLQLHKPPDTLVNLEFADSSKLEIGQRALAIGNPFGLSRTLTTGIISSLDRTVRNPSGTLMKGLVQTDAAINPGNSGGPLLDADGRLIGMNSAILSQSGDSAGIGFAVPINQIKRILPELIATGKVLRPDLGWILADTTHGPMVRRLAEGGAADKAGLQPIERKVDNVFVKGYVRDFERADLVSKVNGQPVQNKDQVEDIISQAGAGSAITLGVRRGGSTGPEREVSLKPVFK